MVRVIAWVIACVFWGPACKPSLIFAQDLLLFMDIPLIEALWALTAVTLRRYTDLQCPKARRRRLKVVQRLVRVLLGDPNIVCGTKTKGEVCLSGGSCTALSAPLGGHLAFAAQRHEAVSMLCMFPSGPFCECVAVVPNGT